MQMLLILNRRPDDGTDVTWNALRLAAQVQKDGLLVKVFLMNDSVDLARDGFPALPDFNLQEMLLELIAKGAEAKLCKTCINRCGIGAGQIRPEIKIGSMLELSEWVQSSDRVISF